MTSSKVDKTEPETTTERSAPSPKKKNPMLIIGLLGLCAIGFIWAMIATFTDFGRTMHPNSTSNNTSKTKVNTEPSERTLTGKSVEQDKKDALAAATKILNLSGNSPTKASTNDRMKSLDRADFTVLDKSLPDLVQFSSQATEAYKVATYQSLVTIDSVLTQKSGKKALAPAASDAYNDVEVDQKIGTAYVPLDTYTNSGAAFSMAMVYVDGKWKLAPYTLVDAIRFSAATASNLSGANSTTAPSSSSAAK